MKTLLYISSVAWVFSIHSVKLETNQSFATEEQSNRHEKRFRFKQKTTTPFTLPSYDHKPRTFMPQPTLTSQEHKTINLFMHKIEFDRQGVSLFLQQTLNHKDYSTEFLPYSFTHITQFIDFAHTSKQSNAFTEGAFRLFLQKLKNCTFVGSDTIERFLEQSEQALILDLAKEDESLWKHFKKTLSRGFKEKFSLIQHDPLGFFEFISKELSQQVTQTIINPERTRMTFLRFLQQATDKIMWSATDAEKTWYSFKKLGYHFYILHTQKVIPDDLDANDLYWSLIERYCYFLKLSGTHLSLETCALIKEDLLKNEYPWLNHKEQESGLTTKRERLTTALLETEAKIYAHKQGIITDILPYQKQRV